MTERGEDGLASGRPKSYAGVTADNLGTPARALQRKRRTFFIETRPH